MKEKIESGVGQFILPSFREVLRSPSDSDILSRVRLINSTDDHGLTLNKGALCALSRETGLTGTVLRIIVTYRGIGSIQSIQENGLCLGWRLRIQPYGYFINPILNLNHCLFHETYHVSKHERSGVFPSPLSPNEKILEEIGAEIFALGKTEDIRMGLAKEVILSRVKDGEIASYAYTSDLPTSSADQEKYMDVVLRNLARGIHGENFAEVYDCLMIIWSSPIPVTRWKIFLRQAQEAHLNSAVASQGDRFCLI